MQSPSKKQQLENECIERSVNDKSTEEEKTILDVLDWSSYQGSSSEESDIRYDLLSCHLEWRPVSPLLLKKASRRWLGASVANIKSSNKVSSSTTASQTKASKQIQALENYLCVVSMMYYGSPYGGKNKSAEENRPAKRSRSSNDLECLTALVSPLRSDFAFERWSPKEIAIFECTLCAYGKKFELVLRLLGQSKDLRGITEFYHLWKQTSHYRAWKEALNH